MRFGIAPEVFEKIPEYCVGIVVAHDVDNGLGNSAAAEVLAQQIASTARESIGPIDSLETVQVWRDALRAADQDPIQYPASIESLLKRIAEKDQIPAINPAVDLANTASILHQVPIGAHDLDRLRGDFVVRLSKDGDVFTPRGKTSQEQVPAGEVVYADDFEVRTRRWVWRLGEKAKVTERSRTIIFPIDGFEGVTDERVRQAAMDLGALIASYLGAPTSLFFVNRDYPFVDLEIEPNPFVDPVYTLLNRGVVEVLPTREDMEARLRSGAPIRIYLGVDPTSPVIHLGHAVQLRKLRQFQDLGHKVVLLIGDFTGRIGDPTDKSAMRLQLTKEQVVENAQTYIDQAAKILDFKSESNPVEVRFNADWWDSMTSRDMIELAGYFTVQQMLQREMFQKRMEENKPIGLHEFLYPLLQGYDSVALDVDAELGGTDQTFNMLCGRSLQKAFHSKEKYVITGPLLEGTDGRKMSKSYGNVIGISDPPYDMYGKVMSLKDELIVRYFEMLTDASLAELRQMEESLAQQSVNPMDLKKRLALTITEQFHSKDDALAAADRFQREVQRREVPEDMPVVTLPRLGDWPIVDLLVTCNLATSKGDARRLVEQGAVHLDGEKVQDAKANVAVVEGAVLRGRKRQYVKLTV